MRKAKRAQVKPDPDEKFSSLCFKVMVDPYVGKLSFIRVFSEKLASDQSVYIVTKRWRNELAP